MYFCSLSLSLARSLALALVLPFPVALSRSHSLTHAFVLCLFVFTPPFPPQRIKTQEDPSPSMQRKRPRNTTHLNKNENWQDRLVIVTSGKYEGEIGRVRGSGHGFIKVFFKNRGEVQKRAVELQLYDGEEAYAAGEVAHTPTHAHVHAHAHAHTATHVGPAHAHTATGVPVGKHVGSANRVQHAHAQPHTAHVHNPKEQVHREVREAIVADSEASSEQEESDTSEYESDNKYVSACSVSCVPLWRLACLFVSVRHVPFAWVRVVVCVSSPNRRLCALASR